MNKIKIILPVLLAAIFFASCKEDKLDTYGGKNNIVFTMKKYPTNSTHQPDARMTYENENFRIAVGNGRSTTVDSVIYSLSAHTGYRRVFVPVSVQGFISDQDRTFDYSIATDLQFDESQGTFRGVEGVDFEVVASYIPAGSDIGGFIIDLKKDNLTISNPQYVVDLRLKANGNFETKNLTTRKRNNSDDIVSMIDMRLYASEFITEPPSWKGHVEANFGYFSRSKYRLMISPAIGIKEGWINFTGNPSDEWNAFKAQYKEKFDKYLKEQQPLGNLDCFEDGDLSKPITLDKVNPYL